MSFPTRSIRQQRSPFSRHRTATASLLFESILAQLLLLASQALCATFFLILTHCAAQETQLYSNRLGQHHLSPSTDHAQNPSTRLTCLIIHTYDH